MKIQTLKIDTIPSILWGEESKKLFIAVHGNMSNKSDGVIKILSENAVGKNYQVLSFDLPEHGERKTTGYLCKVQNCVKDLRDIMNYARKMYDEISLFACSMGAYFSLLEYYNEDLNQCLFISPVVDMKKIIDNMMVWANVSEKELKEKEQINTEFGQTLYWDYYKYVKEHPIGMWDKRTDILYGAKDNLVSRETIEKFVNKSKCNLTIIEDGEHYFHTKEELNYYKNWLNWKII
jgi:esterase/lipase